MDFPNSLRTMTDQQFFILNLVLFLLLVVLPVLAVCWMIVESLMLRAILKVEEAREEVSSICHLQTKETAR